MLDFLKRIVNGFDVFVKLDGVRIGIMRYIFMLFILLYFNIIRDENLIFFIVNNFIDCII